MLSSKPTALTLTFFFYIALALTLASVSDAKGPADVNLIRRDHISLRRLIKKRAPFPQTDGENLAGLIGAAPDPALNDPKSASSTGSTVLSTTATTQTSSSATLPTASPSPVISSPNSITGSSTSSDISSSPVSSSSSTATSSVPLTTSLTPSSTTPAPQTSQTLNVVGVSDPPAVSTPDDTQTITSTATGRAQSATASAVAASSTTTTKKTTIMVLIIIASCVGGIAVIWTIIRKWKFRPSSQFEDRMQPIDWQPTSNPDDGIVHRRLSNASSFHSGSGHIDNNAGHGVGYGATADHSNGLNPLPDHDFTPGVSTLAPVGGYADLARGPNPQPQMQQALRRGPSAARPNFGVPIHHQAGYGAQDPYGGVY